MSEDIPAKDLPLVNKVEAALKRMEGNRRIKRTLTALAKLVGVSRGTLYYHPWVDRRLQRFKVEQAEKKSKPKRATNTTHTFDAVKSDTEILTWKRKCDALTEENEGLKARLEKLRRQVGRNGGTNGDNIVQLPKGPQS